MSSSRIDFDCRVALEQPVIDTECVQRTDRNRQSGCIARNSHVSDRLEGFRTVHDSRGVRSNDESLGYYLAFNVGTRHDY